ncbi:MAG: hypothetical protein IJP34_05925 [Clostridia bacterium]|nr:hypothetical protein [Clostridia bacterium]
MICLVNKIPELNLLNAELVKIKCLYDSYKEDNNVLFWCQNTDKAVISMTDGNMIIFNNGADLEELKEFVEVLSPVCIYSDYNTLLAINRKPDERINVMHRFCDVKAGIESDKLSSDKLYNLLDTDGLSLPEYPYFAVDYCRRKNKGYADYFAIENKCAAISFNSGKLAIINGIASREKGFGSIALNGIMAKNFSRELLVCCRDKVLGFYEKNGFELLYYSGYWVKNK